MLSYSPPNTNLKLTDRKVWRVAKLSDGKIFKEETPQDIKTMIGDIIVSRMKSPRATAPKFSVANASNSPAGTKTHLFKEHFSEYTNEYRS